MVENVVRAFLLYQFEAGLAARSTDDSHAGGARQLHGCAADTAAGAVNQHRLRGLRLGTLKQSAIRRAVGNAYGSALLEAHMVGQAMHLDFIAQDLLGVSAAVRKGGINAVAGLHSLDTWSHSRDDATGIRARRVRQGGFHRVGSGADVAFDWVHPSGMNAHDNLSGTGLRIGDIFQLHPLRTAEFVDSDSFHHFLPRANFLSDSTQSRTSLHGAVATSRAELAWLSRWYRSRAADGHGSGNRQCEDSTFPILRAFPFQLRMRPAIHSSRAASDGRRSASTRRQANVCTVHEDPE